MATRTASVTDAPVDPASGERAASHARLHRMALGGHPCPHGLKAKDILRRHGYRVEEHLLTTRDAVDAFKRAHGVESTPQAFIGGERVGGYDALRERLEGRRADAVTYRPVVAIFAMAAALALAVGWQAPGDMPWVRTLELFAAFAMCLLAVQKLQDVEGFSMGFLGYDLLARRWVPYARIYPFAEGLSGVLMVAGALAWIAAPVALFVGTIGAVSVLKAVYIDGRDLRCACVGGGSRVPLGFVSLLENVVMIAMGLWMGARALLG
jgi:glutaredoxin